MSFPRFRLHRLGLWAAVMMSGAMTGGAHAQQAPEETPSLWMKICNTNPQTQAEQCIVSAELRAQTGMPIAAMSIQVGVQPGKHSVGLVLPLGFMLPPGVALTIDGQKAGQAPFAVCVPQTQQQPAGCVAQALVDDSFISTLKRGNKLSLVLTSPQNKPIPIDLALTGFTKSFDGPGVDRAAADAQRQKLTEALQRNAQQAREKLIELQQKEQGQTN